MNKTVTEFKAAIDTCRDVFVAKTKDYGTSWRIFRPSSITDQLTIKAKRIRSIEEKGTQKVSDSVNGEYIALVNYGVIALIQLELSVSDAPNLTETSAIELYNLQIEESYNLMLAKNHDYSEAWRDMRMSSITDLILAKLLRIRQIEDNAGETVASEGIAANYQDIINYAIFCIIKLNYL